MLTKHILIAHVIILVPKLIYSESNTFPSEFDYLLSINSYVDEIRSEQKLILQQISESFLNIKKEITELRKEQTEMKKVQSRISEDIKQMKESKQKTDMSVEEINKNYMKISENQSNVQENLREITKAFSEVNLKLHFESDCSELGNGIHKIQIPSYSQSPFAVVCNADSHGGGWLSLLRRIDGSVNFYRDWSSYKRGFGNLNGEFFLGLDKIHALTSVQKMELLVILEDSDGKVAYAKYDEFAIGNEEQLFKLKTLGTYSGSAGDSLNYSLNERFSTYDRDHDGWKDGNCAQDRNGGWWYYHCSNCNLDGKYGDNSYNKGIIWNDFRNRENSLKSAEMLIRPRT